LFASFLWLGCAQARPLPTPAEAFFLVRPKTARIYVNEHFVGSSRALERAPVKFTPGTYRITVVAPHHFPHDLQLKLPVGLTQVRVSLRPVPTLSETYSDSDNETSIGESTNVKSFEDAVY